MHPLYLYSPSAVCLFGDVAQCFPNDLRWLLLMFTTNESETNVSFASLPFPRFFGKNMQVMPRTLIILISESSAMENMPPDSCWLLGIQTSWICLRNSQKIQNYPLEDSPSGDFAIGKLKIIFSKSNLLLVVSSRRRTTWSRNVQKPSSWVPAANISSRPFDIHPMMNHVPSFSHMMMIPTIMFPNIQVANSINSIMFTNGYNCWNQLQYC